MTRTNKVWHTREVEVVSSTSTQKLSKEEMLKEEAKEERMAHLMSQIELLSM